MLRSPESKVLLLLPGRWEADAVVGAERAGELVVRRHGHDLTTPRGLAWAAFADPTHTVERLARRYRGRVEAVWSNDEPIGCLLAACVAQRLGLPGTSPAAIVRAQHKQMFRSALATHRPELSVPVTVLPRAIGDRRLADPQWLAAQLAAADRSFPLFCKPVKATFSVLARQVRSLEELVAHLSLPWFDRRLLAAASRPFARLARLLDLPGEVDRPLLEQPLVGEQVNVDGYVWRGRVHLLGIVDEWMYPGEHAGARHFAGFALPSRQPLAVQERLRAAAIAAVEAIGFDHGLFNVELMVGADGSVQVIELNPRAAGQFSTMYRDVLGVELERLALALATGRDPASLQRLPPIAGAAGSFVFRRFDGRPAAPPSATAVAWLRREFATSRLWVERPGRLALRREYRWLGSHRHAVLNLSAADPAALLAAAERCARQLFGVGLVLPGPADATSQSGRVHDAGAARRSAHS